MDLKSFKSLWVIDDSVKPPIEEVVKEAKITNVSYFPSSTVITNSSVISDDNCQPHMEKILEKYQKGFESLNMPGYDFYEFYQAIMNIDPNNQQVIEMALVMAKTMDSSVSKDKLLSQSKYYLDELAKVHISFSTEGNIRKTQILSDRENESKNLESDIKALELKLSELSTDILNKKSNLSSIDNKYLPLLNEIDCKLSANDFAKNKLVSSIELIANKLR